MTENSKIEWCHNTFNPWTGCTKVSPGCDNCYAEKVSERFKLGKWGAGQPRRLASDSYWQQPIAWNRKAAAQGVRKRVFCASLADVFDNEVPDEWRTRLWTLIKNTPHLDWLLLTKRVGNIKRMLPAWWDIPDVRNHVWLGISVVNQEEANRDIPKLIDIPARVRFLSCEPLLGPINLAQTGLEIDISDLDSPVKANLHWVIVGGESGKDARPMHPDWTRSLRDQCAGAGIPFFFKQWGNWKPMEVGESRGGNTDFVLRDPTDKRNPMSGCFHMPHSVDACITNTEYGWRFPVKNVGKKAAGRLLDGREWNEYPEAA